MVRERKRAVITALALGLLGCRPIPVGPEPEVDRVTAALDEACTRRGLASCLDAGRRYEQGMDSEGEDGPAPSPYVAGRAVITYYRGCVMGQGDACARLAQLVSERPGTLEPHRQRLTRLFEHACGTTRPAHPGHCAAAAFHARACELGEPASCGALASLRDGGRLDPGGLGAATPASLHGLACERGWAPSCERLANIFLRGGVHRHRDPTRAARLLDRACEAGTMQACLMLADRYARGDGTVLDPQRARALRVAACEADHAEACHALAEMERRGLGGDRRPGAAMAHLRRACELESPRACEDLARATELGDGVAEDKAAAFELFRRAARGYGRRCDGEDQQACADLGRLLRLGSGGPADEARGRALQRQACEAGNATGCLGVMMRGAFFLPGKNRVIGGQALARACRAGDADACFVLARIGPRALELVSAPSVAAILDRACDLGSAPACNAAAVDAFPPDAQGRAQLDKACRMGDALGCHHLALVAERPGDQQDTDLAVRLHRRACAWSYAPACTRLGIVRSGGGTTGANPGAAATLFERACRLGDSRGCYELGAMRVSGARVAPNRAEGRGLLERACRTGAVAACGLLGSLLVRGRHLERDPAAGEDLLERACREGDPRACALFAELLRGGKLLTRNEDRARVLIERAAPEAIRSCSRALTSCYEPEPSSVGVVWTTFAGWPARAVVGVPACDAALERVCQDASDVALARCRHGDRGCFEAAELLRSMIDAGLAASRQQLEETIERGCQLDPDRCAETVKAQP